MPAATRPIKPLPPPLRIMPTGGAPLSVVDTTRVHVGIWDCLEQLTRAVTAANINVQQVQNGGGLAAYTTVKLASSSLPARRNLNFAGGAVVVDNPVTGNTDVTITSSGGITALTGDGTASGTGSVPFTLATVNANVGTFGDGATSQIAKLTVNTKGLVTAASQSALQIVNDTACLGDLLFTQIAAPAAPGVGLTRVWADSTAGNIQSRVNGGQKTGTAFAATALASQWLKSFDPTTGFFGQTQPAFTDISGTIAGSQLPAFTGDVTKPAGSTVQTLANIPNDVPAAGDILFTNIALPANPGAGTCRLFADSTSGTFRSRDSTAAAASMAFNKPAATSQWLNSFSQATGQFTSLGVNFTDIAGSLWTKTAGAMAFIDTTGHLVDADGNNNFWDATNLRQIIGQGGAYTPAAGAPLTIRSVGTLGTNTSVAIALDKAAVQTIGKTGGNLALSTQDSNSILLRTNAITALTVDPTQNALMSNGGRFEETGYVSPLASANDITVVASTGNTVVITGTTTINRIDTTNWQVGSHLRLIFTTAINIAHQGAVASGTLKPLFLWGAPVGGINVETTSGYTLNLVYDGTNWKEIVESAYTTVLDTSGDSGALFPRRSRLKFTNSFTVVDEPATGSTDVLLSAIPSTVIATIPGRLKSFQLLSTGTGATYTRPAGITSILVEGQGAGGGGGGCVVTAAGQSTAGAGGGAGTYGWHYYATAPATGTYTIGASGTAGANTGAAAGNGGSTTFTDGTTLMTLPGGLGAPTNALATTAATTTALVGLGGGGGGVTTNADYPNTGQAGASAMRILGAIAVSGRGAPGHWGGGNGQERNTSGAGNNATANTGAGGGGGLSLAGGAAVAGGTGATGWLRVWEFS